MTELVSVRTSPEPLRIEELSSFEKPRLSRIRALLSHEDHDLEDIERGYLDWVSYPEYIVLQGEHVHTGEKRWKAVKASKRGNDVYNWRLAKRLNLVNNLPNITFFGWKDRSKRHKTRALFVTLTYARKDLRVDEAWEQVGEDFNRWVSRIKKRFGDVRIIRVWEAQQDGYPHIHAICVFENHEFDAFNYNGVWRAQDKRSLEWEHGFTDVEALASLRGGIKYVLKYLTKLHEIGVYGSQENNKIPDSSNLTGLIGKASVTTLSLMWIFRKRGFSVSGGLLDLITRMHNSNQPASDYVIQVDFDGDPVWVWRLVGFWGGHIGDNAWSSDLSLDQFRKLRSSISWSDAERDPDPEGFL